MKKNEVLVFITLFFIILIISNSIFIITKTNELIEYKKDKLTGKGTAKVSFCINQQPTLNISMCERTTYAENLYTCQVNATDLDYSQNLTFDSDIISGDNLTNITLDGLINFTPENTNEGNHEIYINVTDNSGCPSHLDYDTFTLTILCNNTQPRINISMCSNVAYEDYMYACQVNATDPDEKGNLVFTSEFIFGANLTEINSTGYFNFTANNSQLGYYQVNITVNDSRNCSNSTASAVLNITVYNTNDPPEFNGPIENQSWQENTKWVAFDLDNYFSDPDNDALTYTKSVLNNIDVSIDEKNIVSFTPIADWTGVEYITFFAWDPSGANASSNDIMLTVLSEQVPQTTSPAGGGGAGGFAKCIPEWYCTEWGPCLPEGYQTRQCTDLHDCGTLLHRPNVTQACEYIATCYDGIKNNGEIGIDCGGPCPPCPSCDDGIKNQGELGIDCGGPCKPCPGCTNNIKDSFEEGVDCGGPCPPCPTCNDEKKNCHKIIQEDGSVREVCEIGIDCGGPCKPCPGIEVPGYLQERNRKLTLIMIIIIVSISILLIIYRFTNEQIKKFLAKAIFYVASRKKREKEKELLALSFADKIINRLNKLESKLPRKYSTHTLSSEFSRIVREYFKDILNLQYEFTYDELLKEIKKKGLNPEIESLLVDFFNRATKIEFAGHKLRRRELQSLINEAKEIVHLTSKEEEDKKLKLIQIPKEIKDVDKVFIAITNIEKLLSRNDIKRAMKLYLKTLDAYNDLKEKDKDIIYPVLKRLYKELKLAAGRE